MKRQDLSDHECMERLADFLSAVELAFQRNGALSDAWWFHNPGVCSANGDAVPFTLIRWKLRCRGVHFLRKTGRRHVHHEFVSPLDVDQRIFLPRTLARNR